MKNISNLGNDGIMYTCMYMTNNYTTNKNINKSLINLPGLTSSCVDVLINPKQMIIDIPQEVVHMSLVCHCNLMHKAIYDSAG